MARIGRGVTGGGQKYSEFQRGYNSFSGADIKAMFAGVAFSELQALSYSIEREKAGIWTLGQVNPRSFLCCKRAIAGTCVALNFDRHPLLDLFDYTGGYFMSDVDDIRPDWKNPDDLDSFNLYSSAVVNEEGYVDGATWGQVASQYTSNPGDMPGPETVAAFQESAVTSPYDDQRPAKVWHVDQIMPFNIAVAAANEYGHAASMKIYGVELLNETSGFSVDDMVVETSWTFVAREIGPWQPSLDSAAQAARLFAMNNVT